MGLTLTAQAMRYSRARFSARLVLLVIAHHADEGSASTTLTVASLSRLTNLSRRAVFSAVRDLERIGELRIETQPGRYAPNRQTVTLTAEPPPDHPSDEEERRARRRVIRSRSRTIWDRDGWECRLRLDDGCTGHRCLTIGHIVSIEEGGSDDSGNLQTECLHCNAAKGTR